MREKNQLRHYRHRKCILRLEDIEVTADVQGTVQLWKPVSVKKWKKFAHRGAMGKIQIYFANYVRGKIKNNNSKR